MPYLVELNEDKKRRIIELVTAYLMDYGSSECIAQSDKATFKAIDLCCEIADVAEAEYYD